MDKRTKQQEQRVFNRVDVFGLFQALKQNGSARLCDHFINDDDDK